MRDVLGTFESSQTLPLAQKTEPSMSTEVHDAIRLRETLEENCIRDSYPVELQCLAYLLCPGFKEPGCATQAIGTDIIKHSGIREGEKDKCPMVV